MPKFPDEQPNRRDEKVLGEFTEATLVTSRWYNL